MEKEHLYQELYFSLFRELFKTSKALEEGRYADAYEILIAAQQNAEEQFLSATDLE